MDDLDVTPLFDLHAELGARMVPFAGHSMPVQYPLGVMQEHLHCRAAAGLFDVSHMGQVWIDGASWEAVALGLETLIPQDVLGLKDGRQRYGFFTNETGGIEDDLMFARRGDRLFVVINAACRAADIARMKAGLEPDLKVTPLEDRALIALQGPKAEEALATLTPNCAAMRFMDVADHDLNGANAWISRSGYTGEDGFEISVPADQAEKLCRDLLALDSVQAIGLGARDSLRLEAGLCLYGHDIDTATTPAEAALKWAIQKVRRSGGARGGGFPGADSVLQDPKRLRIGLLPVGRAPMREGTQLFTDQHGGDPVGQITSGGFGPTLGAPVAMGYVETQHAAPETRLYGEVRGKRLPAIVTALPFVPARFKR